jgi:hypothetical protein
MSYYPVRCTKCRARRTLEKHPLHYVKPPRCKQCKGEMRLDEHRIAQHKKPATRRTDPGPVCHCAAAPARDGRNMPHRAGSLPTCVRYGVPF